MSINGCQLPSLPKISIGVIRPAKQSIVKRIKRLLAVPWNQHVKQWLKRAYYTSLKWRGTSPAQVTAKEFSPVLPLVDGDLVRVRSSEEILSTLDPFKELKGCAFLPNMEEFCETEQRVLKAMRSFLDERDYKVKKVRGLVLLENVICHGTPAFGTCDRCCFFFWREEWLEKITH